MKHENLECIYSLKEEHCKDCTELYAYYCELDNSEMDIWEEFGNYEDRYIE